ncbi:hypothetical protein D0C16_10535 [Cellvibrio sp. KY-GH-1]|uniref:hypothetical protein n=1 Tax=Cellvibrio sp. KY-GH-1 TaxID=2303332 RepID=UPI00124481AA|nr:hypothetical protein [Cellvibrio sp. KY-GH-1]QEY16379.1 hypothetical protein D0C16_10535 [Cellvibrio sp. KY-GH-1]
MEERIIYWIVALLIWIPLVTDQYLLEYKSIEGVVTHIAEPIRSQKGFKSVSVKIKEPNAFAKEYSVNPSVAEMLSINVKVTLHESRLLFRVVGIEQNGVLASNRNGGINMVILGAIFLLPLYLLSLSFLWLYRKFKRF